MGDYAEVLAMAQALLDMPAIIVTEVVVDQTPQHDTDYPQDNITVRFTLDTPAIEGYVMLYADGFALADEVGKSVGGDASCSLNYTTPSGERFWLDSVGMGVSVVNDDGEPDLDYEYYDAIALLEKKILNVLKPSGSVFMHGEWFYHSLTIGDLQRMIG